MTLQHEDANGTGFVDSASNDSGDPLDTRQFLPVRYLVKEDDAGRYLSCVDAPNIAVRMDRGFSVSASAARKYKECSIFLDGAAQSEPFMDVQRRIYNLDHHEGCVRAFTLATCEQAMVVVTKGLDLGGEHWNVYGNEPDLDTVLAVWVLLNHLRLSGNGSEMRRRIMPVVRLQGVIDAHGFELRELAAFPEAMEKEVSERIQDLRRRELQLKEEGAWEKSDPLAYTVEALQLVDEMVYSPQDFSSQEHVEELVRLPIGSDRIVLGCRADVGIYEVEQHLKSVHGDRIGIILLDKGDGVYTLRQVDPFLQQSLEAVYRRLNQIDPAVVNNAGWGGAGEIGGSPRGRGSGLDARQIAEVCQWVFRRATAGRRLGMAALAFGTPLLGLGVLVGAVQRSLPTASSQGLLSSLGAAGYGNFSVLLTAVLVVAMAAVARGRKRLFGLLFPANWGWLWLLPVMILAALAGGAWVPLDLAKAAGGPLGLGWAYLIVAAVSVVAVEVLFRSLVHGLLVPHFNISYPGGPWLLSTPNLVAAAGYAVAVLLLFEPAWWQLGAGPYNALDAAGSFAAAFSVGLAAGLGRERWNSVLVPVMLHLLAAVVAWVVLPLAS